MRRTSVKTLAGLSPTDIKVLYHLIVSNRPLTVKELVSRTALSSPQLGRILSKLIKEDLVTYVTVGFIKASPELAAKVNLRLENLEGMHGKTKLFIPKVSLQDLKTIPKIADWIDYLEYSQKK